MVPLKNRRAYSSDAHADLFSHHSNPKEGSMTSRFLPIITLAVALSACGSPSESDIQATVQAAVQATSRAELVAVSVKATQEAADVCGKMTLNTYADAVEEEIRTFEMQISVTQSTPRGSIGTALQRMVDLQTEMRRMKTPECLKAYHERIVSMMGLYRLAFQNFAAQGTESMTTAALQMGQQDLDAVKKDLQTIRAGTVPTVPTPAPTPKA
jgi:hypothetical protein